MKTMTPSAAARLTAILLSGTLTLPACATTGTGRPPPSNRVTDPTVLADYVQRLPAGSAVRVERAAGGSVRGTLMKATGDSVIVQPRTRVPEPPIEIPLTEVLTVSPDDRGGTNIARAIGIGAAAGAGAALAVFFVILAALD